MMLDIKKIREEYEEVKKAIESRGQGSFGIENILQSDEKRRGLLATVEQMKNRQNVDSKEIPVLKKQGKDTTALMSEMKQLSDAIKKLDGEVGAVEEEIKNTLLYLSLIHISEPTRLGMISYAVFCLKKKKKNK